ncbi:hypothetical protein [Kitasatospora sp. HPMI-4]|uniref:hypothetical protein n=1 Tax=Kitasatospora sp. HPMI-4 TaxID=3448443 RepID=UPI003F1B9316
MIAGTLKRPWVQRGACTALEVGHLIGTDLDPERWSELKVNAFKHSAARPS